ncbi:hypothetical protein ACX93W_14180 [Paenibacillus sp. CAU 1782]
MLDLDHPAWAMMEGPFGSAEQVPGLIMKLRISNSDMDRNDRNVQ